MFKIIDTPCGKVKGIIEDDILKFKGIRYATSERWKYPTLVTKWEGVLDAYEYGPCCYQRRAFVDEEKENSLSERIEEYLKKAEAILEDEQIERDSYYAFVCEKCAPSFDYFGYFMFAKELYEKSREIYERS